VIYLVVFSSGFVCAIKYVKAIAKKPFRQSKNRVMMKYSNYYSHLRSKICCQATKFIKSERSSVFSINGDSPISPRDDDPCALV
jgi:hypothetical protein